MKQVSGSVALIQSLIAEGVTTLFGIPGVDTLGVYDAMADYPELRAINVRHEQSAVFMADGYARSSGGVGVALTSGGPGALNTLTAMATAHNDSVAVLHLVNENPAHVRKKAKGYFHDLSDQLGVFRPVTDFTFQATLASEIQPGISLAMAALRNRRPRPAMVEIAGDAFAQPCHIESTTPLSPQRRQPTANELDQAASIIRSAKSPVIWAGGGVIASRATKELLELAERLGAPVLTSQAGKGSFPPDHRLHIGNWANEKPVRDLLDRSDVMIAVGTRFSYFPTGGWSLELPKQIVQIDLDPSEIGRNYPVAAGVIGDGLAALSGLLERIDGSGGTSRHQEVAEVTSTIAERVGVPPEIEVLNQIRAALPANARVFNDPTTIAFWARSHWPAYEPRTWFVPSGFGTLGFALPAAIGAKFATPDAPSVAIMGDAGVMFTIQDLMTAVEHSVPIVLIVFNDEGYGVERRHQDHLYGRRNGVDLQPPDFVALAKSFGAKGHRVNDISKLRETIEAALDSREPVLIEVPNQFSHPGYGAWVNWDE